MTQGLSIIIFSISIFLLLSWVSYKPSIRLPIDTEIFLMRDMYITNTLPPRRNVPKRYQPLFETISKHYDIPPSVLESIAYVESRFKADALSPLRKDGSRDMGMFQFNSNFIPWLRKEFSYGISFNPLSVNESIIIAAELVVWLYKKYKHWPDVFLAYNCGVTNVDRNTIPESAWGYLDRIYRK